MGTAEASASREWRRHWPMVVAATAGMSTASISTSAFGVMIVPIEQDTGWTRAEISVGPMLISLMVMLCATLGGYAIDKLGPRSIALFALCGLCGSTAAISLIGNHVWQWWGLWTLIGLFGCVMPAVWMAPLAGAFSAARGLAMAVVLSGTGITSFIVPNLATRLLQDVDWRTAYLYIAIIWFAVAFTLTFLFIRPRKTTQNAQQSKASAAIGLPGLSAAEGFRSASFYKLLAATVIANLAGIAMILNLVPILQSTGLIPATAALIFSFVGIATILGRLVSGALLDRFEAKWIAVGTSALMIALPAALLLLPGNVVASGIGVVIYGFMGGAMMPCVSYLASRHFGQKAFGTLYATIMAAMSIGIGLGPFVANLVYDAVQSYNPVLIATIPIFAVGALLFASLGAYPDFRTPETDR